MSSYLWLNSLLDPWQGYTDDKRAPSSENHWGLLPAESNQFLNCHHWVDLLTFLPRNFGFLTFSTLIYLVMKLMIIQLLNCDHHVRFTISLILSECDFMILFFFLFLACLVLDYYVSCDESQFLVVSLTIYLCMRNLPWIHSQDWLQSFLPFDCWLVKLLTSNGRFLLHWSNTKCSILWIHRWWKSNGFF